MVGGQTVVPIYQEFGCCGSCGGVFCVQQASSYATVGKIVTVCGQTADAVFGIEVEPEARPDLHMEWDRTENWTQRWVTGTVAMVGGTCCLWQGC